MTEKRDGNRPNLDEVDPNLLDPNEVPVLEIGGGLGVIGQGMRDNWTAAQINVGSRIDVIDEPDLEIDLELLIVFDGQEGRFVCQEMTGRRRNGGPEVTQARIRPARIAEYIRAVVPGLLVYMDERGQWQRFESFENLVPAFVRSEAAKHGPTPETLKWAARLYRAAEVINAHPIKAVTEQLGLSTRTAHNWIAKARADGLLEMRSSGGDD
ncbi:hypothetical protein ACFVAJ_11260 [Agromyces sp. NPDC057679]|uniref:hypothetical protein n=1 Tax=Agromyces sp. NPDC057679 TaxID=3346207 RepID=UPI00366DC970